MASSPISAGQKSKPATKRRSGQIYAVEKPPYAIECNSNETRRLYGVIDRRLWQSRFIAGDDYSIANMAIFPWLRNWQGQGIVLDELPHLKACFEGIAARPAVARAVLLMAGLRKPQHDAKAHEILFGSTQYRQR